MADYPDYTDLMQIIGSDIMIPMDIQAAYIMMPVDIQAQYVDLDINIKSQEVTINIDIDAQSVGVYLQADWSALQSYDKNFTAFGEEVAVGGTAHESYTVTTGKTLYICGLSFYIFATNPTDGDKNQIGYAYLHNQTDNIDSAFIGGNGGGGITFPKPVPFAEGKELRCYVVNWSNHVCDIGVSAWGYEL